MEGELWGESKLRLYGGLVLLTALQFSPGTCEVIVPENTLKVNMGVGRCFGQNQIIGSSAVCFSSDFSLSEVKAVYMFSRLLCYPHNNPAR